MKAKDQEKSKARYRQRVKKHGYAPESLGWGKGGRQAIRFAVLTEELCKNPKASVLDVGCGFADLYGFLLQKGWQGNYTGLEMVPELVQIAHQQYPNARIILNDFENFASENFQHYDFVIASGIFNAKLQGEPNETYILRTLEAMMKICNTAVCVDFQSSYVDFQQPSSWHTDPGWLIPACRGFSRRMQLRLDYMLYEFSLFLFKNDLAGENHVFQELL